MVLSVSTFALTFLGALAGQGAVPVTDSVTAFVDVAVIPMDRERVLSGQTVIVRDGRIAQIGPAKSVRIPAGAVRIDGRGKFLLPGLAEMHAHIPGGEESDAEVERTLFLFLANGVTTIRGMQGDPRHLALRERAAKGELLSPVIYTAGPWLGGEADAVAITVKQQHAAGYDLLKIGSPTGAAFDTMAAVAHRVGIPFAGHVPRGVGIERAVAARYASIDHLDGYVEYLVAAGAPVDVNKSQWFGVNLGLHLDESKIAPIAAATKRAGVWNVPTQVLIENLASSATSKDLAQRPEMRYVPSDELAGWGRAKDGFFRGGTTPESARRTVEARRRLIKALHDAGAGLLLGSDAPQIYNVPGFSVHRELEVLVAAGLTPYQALETGTRNIAVYFNTANQTGTVAEGKRADLILLDANPLKDIRHTTRQAGVMIGGRWLSRADLDARLAKYVVRR